MTTSCFITMVLFKPRLNDFSHHLSQTEPEAARRFPTSVLLYAPHREYPFMKWPRNKRPQCTHVCVSSMQPGHTPSRLNYATEESAYISRPDRSQWPT